MWKVLEGNVTGIGFGTTIPVRHGGIVSIPKVDDALMVCPGGVLERRRLALAVRWRLTQTGPCSSHSRSVFLWSILVLPMTTTTTRTTRLPHLPLPLSSTGRFPHHHHSFTQPSLRSTARLHRHFLPFRGLRVSPISARWTGNVHLDFCSFRKIRKNG